MDTLFSVEKRSENLYVLDYPYDYGLEELLTDGVSDTFALCRFVQKRNHAAKRSRFRMGGGGCTTFCVRDGKGHPLMGRNFDYRDAPCLVVRTAPEKGYRSVAVTDLNVMLYGFRHSPGGKNERRLFLAPWCCMDGVNEKGLSIAVLELKARATRQKSGKIPLTTTAVIRAALDTCAGVEAVIRLFEKHDLRAALGCDYHYQVLDATGDCAVLEYTKNRLHILRGQPYAMNFYFSADGDNRREMGREREEKVRAALTASCGTMEPEQAMALLERCGLHYRHRLGHMVSCLWSAVYDCADASVTVCAGDYSRSDRFEQRERT